VAAPPAEFLCGDGSARTQPSQTVGFVLAEPDATGGDFGIGVRGSICARKGDHAMSDHDASNGSLFNDPQLHYSRADAIQAGILVDVSETAAKAGIKFPVALSVAVWHKYVALPDGVERQDEQGRLWDLLQILGHAIATKSHDGDVRWIDFTVMVDNGDGPKPVKLSSHCGPGDTAEPVVTVMLPIGNETE
jgi:hypothetical protein